MQRRGRKRGPLRRFVRRRKKDFEFALFYVVYHLARVLPRWLGSPLFGCAGWGLSFAAAQEYRRCHSQLSKVYGPVWAPGQIDRCARGVFYSAGRNLFDAVTISRNPQRWFASRVSSDSLDDFKRSFDKGKGVLALTGHIGCFELLLPFMASKGFACLAVGQRLFDPRVDAIVRRARSGNNMEYFSRSDSPLALVRKLREGRVLGALIDQDTDVEGVFAHFFGELAYTPAGLVRFALRFSVPVFVFATARLPGGRHHVFVHGPLVARGNDLTEQTVRMVEQANGILENVIRQFPEQWVWMHRRWRRKPSQPRNSSVVSIEQYSQTVSAV